MLQLNFFLFFFLKYISSSTTHWSQIFPTNILSHVVMIYNIIHFWYTNPKFWLLTLNISCILLVLQDLGLSNLHLPFKDLYFFYFPIQIWCYLWFDLGLMLDLFSTSVEYIYSRYSSELSLIDKTLNSFALWFNQTQKCFNNY